MTVRSRAYFAAKFVTNGVGGITGVDMGDLLDSIPLTTEVQLSDAELAALAGVTSAADTLAYFTGSGTATTTPLTAAGRALIDDADAATQRATLGLVIGTNVQAFDAELAAIAGLTSAADSAPYFTGSGTAALMTVTAAARTVLDDTTTSAMLATLAGLPLAGGTMTGTITSTIGTITADTPALTATQTWNASGTTFKPIFLNVVATAAASGSRLIDLQSSSASRFSVDSAGATRTVSVFANTFTESSFGRFDLSNNSTGLGLGSGRRIFWCATDVYNGTIDTGITRNAAGVLEVNNGTAGTYRDLIGRTLQSAPSSANGQSLNIKNLTELTTIAAAATTDTTIQIPAGALVLAVSVRVTTVIPTATTFDVGDSGLATRYSTASVSTAANTTDAGTKAGAYYNASALSVRLTMNGGTPAANTGRVRVTIFYIDSTPPTS